MIKSIKIEGFQSHVNTFIEFDPFLNIITGPSDSGKSAILRALKKCIRDLPAGNDFVNIKTSICEITVNIGIDVIRKLTKDKKTGSTKTNEYKVGEADFGGFNREIPLEVQNAFNMPLLNLGDIVLDLHFVDQHDPAFLIGATDSVKSKVLGSVSGLNVIDAAIKKANKDVRQISSELKIVDKDVQTIQDAMTLLPNIEELQQNTAIFNEKFSDIKQKQVRLDVLTQLSTELTNIVQKGKTLNQELADLPDINIDFNAVKQKIANHKALIMFDAQLTEITSKITMLEQDSILTFEAPLFDNVKQKMNSLTSFKGMANTLDNLGSTEMILVQEMQQLDIDIECARKNWEEFLDKLGICPLCKQGTKGLKL